MERRKETPSHVAVPATRSVPEEEIARRRAVYDRLMRLRDQMKPMDISAGELIRQVRQEADRRG
ncbi:MAG: hypothetical protein HYX94_04975 [Chloroflexi bacterium]|nr:hypothetical protein [Chloroflexota bacterium]